MFDFIKYKYVSIGFSLVLIVFGLGYTYFVHGGFANSLDFNGGLRTVIEFEPKYGPTKIGKLFCGK